MKKTKEILKANKGVTVGTAIFIVVAILFIIIIARIVIVKTQSNDTQTPQPAQQSSTEQKTPQSQPDQQPKDDEFVQKLDDGRKVNTSQKVKETKSVSGIEISDIQLTENGGISTITATAKNVSQSNMQEKNVKVEVLDKNGQLITTFSAVINEMKPGETSKINASVTVDVSNAYDLRIVE